MNAKHKIKVFLREILDDWRSPLTSDDALVISVSLCLLMVPVGIVLFGG